MRESEVEGRGKREEATASAGSPLFPLPSSPAPQLLVVSLGVRPYLEALELQRAVARARITGAIAEDVLLLVEHPPVVTLGRATKAQHLTTPAWQHAERGVELHEVERGGDVTFHGPGQLVGYPVVDLKRHRRDLHWYLRQVEEALIVALAGAGVPAGRHAGYTGVWTGDGDGASWVPRRKIASIGVHARDWVTWHGFALNVTTDLSYFGLIVPCGIGGVQMTSVARERDGAADVREIGRLVAEGFGHVFSLAPRAVPLDALALDLLTAAG